MKQLKPTVVIPMHYRTKALGLMGYVFGKVDKFISVRDEGKRAWGAGSKQRKY